MEKAFFIRSSFFKKIFCLAFFFASVGVFGQTPQEQVSEAHEEKQKEADLVGVPVFLDAFEIYPEKWKAMAFVDVPFYSFYLGTPKFNGVAFLPNFNPDMGVSLGYRGATLRLTEPFQILPDYENTRRGTSTKQEYIFSFSWHQFAIDLYSQYYKGFYVSSPITSLAGGQPQRYAQLPDTQVHNAGINIYLALSPERYSIAAAFSHEEFQFKSGGSILINTYLNRLDMNPGSQFIAGTAAGADKMPEIVGGTFWSAGLSGGYGYTYSYKRFFATAQGVLGFGPQFQEINDPSGREYKFNSQMKINGSVAFGMNRRYDFAGFQALGDSVYGEIENGQLASSLVSAIMYYGRRF